MSRPDEEWGVVSGQTRFQRVLTDLWGRLSGEMTSTSSPAGLKASLEAKQWAKKRADATRAAEAKRLARSRHYLATHSLS